MKKYVLIWLLLLLPLVAMAQELKVRSLEADPMDLSASTQPRNDKVGNPCALVKVLMVDGIDRVEGNVIGDVEDRGTEKWVYLSAGTKMMKIIPKNHLPLMIMFDDYGIKRVESKVTYVLTLVMPQGRADCAADSRHSQRLLLWKKWQVQGLCPGREVGPQGSRDGGQQWPIPIGLLLR